MAINNTLFFVSSNQIPIFDGEHYDYWSSQMETIFISLNLWDVVESGYDEPLEEGTKETWSELQQREFKENVSRNASALRIIQQGVSKSTFRRIFGIKKAKEAWDVLKKEFQGSDRAIAVKHQTLWRNFDTQMKETENVRDFFSRTAEIVNQIRSCGDTIKEMRIVQKILRSLPQKYDHVVAAIEESKDLTKLSMYKLMGSLEAHKQRMVKFESQPLDRSSISVQN